MRKKKQKWNQKKDVKQDETFSCVYVYVYV